jgi:hypothetical protein
MVLHSFGYRLIVIGGLLSGIAIVFERHGHGFLLLNARNRDAQCIPS